MGINILEHLAYLDHNVIDSMAKGDRFRVKPLLKKSELTAVFSDENLREINRSKGYESTFLEVLKDIGARYLIPILGANFQHTGKAQIRLIDPFDAYKSYEKNVEPMPEFGYGLTGMLEKFYGGLKDTSFKEISERGVNELKELLEGSLDGLNEVEGIDEKTKKQLRQTSMQLPDILNAVSGGLAAHLDNENNESQVCQFEKAAGVGPRILKNIQGPDVLLKVWEHVRQEMPDVKLELETFFGIKAPPWSDQPERELTTLEKVNAIYHQLNFVGYYRDSNMKVRRRFIASFSDMTHAGLATFCNRLICCDKDFVMKAAAAYEYLDVKTVIEYFES